MSYNMSQRASDFRMLSSNQAPALAAVQEFVRSGNDQDAMQASSLEQALEAYDWFLEVDSENNVVDIEFGGEKLRVFTAALFNAIAPFVEPGSYIEMYDGESWRWLFNGKTCREVKPIVVWPE